MFDHTPAWDLGPDAARCYERALPVPEADQDQFDCGCATPVRQPDCIALAVLNAHYCKDGPPREELWRLRGRAQWRPAGAAREPLAGG